MSGNKVDWSELHRRMEVVRAALEAEPAPAERARILKERARELAVETARADPGETIEVVGFSLAHEIYALESAWVREVALIKEFTPLPCTPRFLLGLVNVRGRILSVIDIKKFFDLPEKGLTDLNKILVLRSECVEFGVLADTILGVHTLALAELQPPPAGFSGVHEAYLKGIDRTGKIVLDARRLLNDERLLIRQEVG
ncbi:MAG TPA: chemotaxis protein CheW [Methylococcaceae bacterium]|nr:chemotaxis protein CheW [Methylococcaceae bacterium]